MAKGVGGKKKLKFKTTERVNASKRRKWIIIFVVVIIAVSVASVLTYFKENPVNKSEEENNSSLSSQTNMKKYVSILFAGTKTDVGDVLILLHITLNTADKKFTVTPLPASEITSVKAADIVKDTSQKFNIDIDRYVLINEKQIKYFMGALGLYEVDLDSRVNYNGSEFSLNLASGSQTLTGDKFFRYLQYLGLGESDSALKKQGEAVADLIAQRVNASNCAKGEKLFEDLINSSESDITIVDFQKYKGFFDEVSEKARVVDVELVGSAD